MTIKYTTLTPETRALMKRVYKHGFNIYQMVNRLGKELNLRVDLPEVAIERVCLQWLSTKDKVKANYPWFKKAIHMECTHEIALMNVDEGKKHKNEPMVLGEILRRISNEP